MREACAYANVTFYNSDSFLIIAYLHVKNKMFTNRVHTHILYVDTLSVWFFLMILFIAFKIQHLFQQNIKALDK